MSENEKAIHEYLPKLESVSEDLIKITKELTSNKPSESSISSIVNQIITKGSKDQIFEILKLFSCVLRARPNIAPIILKQILDIEESIRSNFSKSEIYEIFRYNNFLLLCLYEKNFISIDNIETGCKFNLGKLMYFYPELKDEKPSVINDLVHIYTVATTFFHKMEKSSNCNDFKKKRKNNLHSDKEIAKIIIDDNISKLESNFQASWNEIVEISIYENDEFLNNEKLTLIEYAAFFGSEKIFNYFINDVNPCPPNLKKCAIIGGNSNILMKVEKLEQASNRPYPFDEDNLIASIRYFRDFFFNILIEKSYNAILFNSLLESLKSFNLLAFMRIIEHQPNIISLCNSLGQTALHIASTNGLGNIVDFILKITKEPSFVNKRDDNGETALHIACEKGFSNIVATLVIEGMADITICDNFGLPPFMIACQFEHLDIIKFFIKQFDINPYEVNRSGWTILHFASNGINLNCFQFILKKYPKLSSITNNVGDTPLHICAMKNKGSFIKLLLKQNDLNPNAQNRVGETPLHLAAMFNCVNAVKELIKSQNIDINLSDMGSQTPLYLAAEHQSVDVVKILLDNDAIDINKTNLFKDTPLHAAARSQNSEIIELLVSHPNIDINAENNRLSIFSYKIFFIY